MERWSHFGGQNGDRPAADFWRCVSCGLVRIQIADVEDVEALCDHVVNSNGRYLGDGSGRQIIEHEDAAAFLRVEIWEIYRRWDPAFCRFRAYASTKLVHSLGRLRREQIDRADRPGGTKAHAFAVSLSTPLRQNPGEEDGALTLGETLAGRAEDDPASRDLDVRRILAG